MYILRASAVPKDVQYILVLSESFIVNICCIFLFWFTAIIYPHQVYYSSGLTLYRCVLSAALGVEWWFQYSLIEQIKLCLNEFGSKNLCNVCFAIVVFMCRTYFLGVCLKCFQKQAITSIGRHEKFPVSFFSVSYHQFGYFAEMTETIVNTIFENACWYSYKYTHMIVWCLRKLFFPQNFLLFVCYSFFLYSAVHILACWGNACNTKGKIVRIYSPLLWAFQYRSEGKL